MFSWCKTCSAQPPGAGYLVFKDQQPPKFYQQFADIKQADLRNNKASVLKVNKSDFETLSKALVGKDRKFTDVDFSPQEKTLGSFPNIPSDKWKRLSELVAHSNFLPKQEKPFALTKTHQMHNKGFIAAVSALSESNEKLRSLFGQSGVGQNGIYRFLLRHKGAVEEIVIDDYVPIDDKGQPYFTHPQQQFLWPSLLQKARAKLYGSYQLMSKVSSPRQVLIQTTLAPVDILKNNPANSQDLWLKVIAALANKFVLIGNTSNSQKINWQSIGLTPAHHYTIIDAATLLHKFQNSFRVVKLRNAFRHEEYKGEGSLAVDPLFWDQIENTEEKTRLDCKDTKQGIIYMLFSDYLKYFDETLINYYTPVRNYINEPCVFQSQNGLVYEVTILKDGDYSFCLDQAEMQVEKKGLEYIEEGWARSTILVIKDNSSNVTQDYEFIDGTMKYNQQYSHIRAKLKPGKYIIYVKIDPTIKNSNFPKKISLSVCSSQTVQIKSSLQISYGDLLKKTFLNHGRANKRQLYNNNLMWASWKLIPQGGYAYMAFGNSSESQSKFVIKFKEEVFSKQNYTMKKPFKGRGDQVLQILPGHEEIILLRIKNSEIKQVNFPPPIDLQIIGV